MFEDREYFYIGDRNKSTNGNKNIDGIWKSVLKYGVLTASHFEARFPDDPALSEGKDEFLQLPKISVEPWSGMKRAVTVKGEMTSETRTLFLRIIDSEDIRLWNFVLFRDGKKLLSVSDCNDRIVTEHFAKEFMEKLFHRWFEAIPEPEINPQEGETGEFLEILREMTQEIVSMLERDQSIHG